MSLVWGPHCSMVLKQRLEKRKVQTVDTLSVYRRQPEVLCTSGSLLCTAGLAPTCGSYLAILGCVQRPASHQSEQDPPYCPQSPITLTPYL